MSDATTLEPTMDELMQTSYAGRTTKVGDLVKGTVVKIAERAVFIDYGAKSEGVADLGEFNDASGVPQVKVGDTLDVVVTTTKPYVKLSVNEAKASQARETLREAFRFQKPVEGLVIGQNKGGFEVRVSGVRAFCPASQIGERQGTNPAEIINQTFEFRITEWDDGKGMVVSRRAVLDEARKAAREELGGRFNVGDVLQGRVTQVRDFGAFVDLGGVEGMIHVTEMGAPRVKSPGERVAVGDAVEVIVLRVESDKGRVALRLRQDEAVVAQSNAFATSLSVGQRLTGTVARMQSFGAFITLAPGTDGLLHVGAITTERRIDSPSQVLKEGQSIEVIVESIDVGKGRISLCTPEVFERRGAPAATVEVGQVVKGRVQKVERFGVFLELGARLTGLLPTSEMEAERGANLVDLFPIGKEVEVQVLSIDTETGSKDGKAFTRKRIRLSQKALKGESEAADYREYKAREQSGGVKQSVTFGDLFAAKFKR